MSTEKFFLILGAVWLFYKAHMMWLHRQGFKQQYQNSKEHFEKHGKKLKRKP